MRHLPNGQTVPLLPSPVQMTSVISVSHSKRWEKKCNKWNFLCFYHIPFAPLLLPGHWFVMWSLPGQWTLSLTSLGFQDLQWAEPAVVHLLLLRTVCTLRPRWWDNPSNNRVMNANNFFLALYNSTYCFFSIFFLFASLFWIQHVCVYVSW